jgi:hypothetical protein
MITLIGAQREYDHAVMDTASAQGEVKRLEDELGVAREKAMKCFHILVDCERRLEQAKAGGGAVDVTETCQRDHTKLRSGFCPACGAPKGK